MVCNDIDWATWTGDETNPATRERYRETAACRSGTSADTAFFFFVSYLKIVSADGLNA